MKSTVAPLDGRASLCLVSSTTTTANNSIKNFAPTAVCSVLEALASKLPYLWAPLPSLVAVIEDLVHLLLLLPRGRSEGHNYTSTALVEIGSSLHTACRDASWTAQEAAPVAGLHMLMSAAGYVPCVWLTD